MTSIPERAHDVTGARGDAALRGALEALGDGTRRRIVTLLRERPRSVGELADSLPVSQPAVSQHLRILREAALVRTRAEGRRRIQELDPVGFGVLRSWVETFWDGALGAFRASFDEVDDTRGPDPITNIHEQREEDR